MKLHDGRSSFYQWDLNQKLTAPDLEVGEEVHFSNTTMKEALVVKAYSLDNGDIVVNVPNILLQYAMPITVYRHTTTNDSKGTCKKYVFQVQARPKPTDYVYTEVEISNYSSVEQRMTELENNLPNEIDKGIDDLIESGRIESYVVQSVIEHTEQIEKDLDAVRDIALDASLAISYSDYAEMVKTLNGLPASSFKSGQDINIVTTNVPDIWVAFIEDTQEAYTYVDDETIVQTLSDVGTLKVGYFILAQRETQKVYIEDLAKKDQVPKIHATLKSNGAYTITITMGVE